MTTNSNYLQKLLSTIDLNVEMRDRLMFRNDKLKEMFKQDDKYSDYELNEFRITMIKTENEIDVMNKVIYDNKFKLKIVAEVILIMIEFAHRFHSYLITVNRLNIFT